MVHVRRAVRQTTATSQPARVSRGVSRWEEHKRRAYAASSSGVRLLVPPFGDESDPNHHSGARSHGPMPAGRMPAARSRAKRRPCAFTQRGACAPPPGISRRDDESALGPSTVARRPLRPGPLVPTGRGPRCVRRRRREGGLRFPRRSRLLRTWGEPGGAVLRALYDPQRPPRGRRVRQPRYLG
jgi:hypothetical protein